MTAIKLLFFKEKRLRAHEEELRVNASGYQLCVQLNRPWFHIE